MNIKRNSIKIQIKHEKRIWTKAVKTKYPTYANSGEDRGGGGGRDSPRKVYSSPRKVHNHDCIGRHSARHVITWKCGNDMTSLKLNVNVYDDNIQVKGLADLRQNLFENLEQRCFGQGSHNFIGKNRGTMFIHDC